MGDPKKLTFPQQNEISIGQIKSISLCEEPQYKLFHSPDKNNSILIDNIRTAYII